MRRMAFVYIQTALLRENVRRLTGVTVYSSTRRGQL